MPSYHRLGELPPKRHIQFRQPDGSLYAEEVFGSEGFSGNYSILYHVNPPTRVKKVERFDLPQPQHELWNEGIQRHHHFHGNHISRGGDAVMGNQVMMFNNDVSIGLARPDMQMDYFYRHAECDLLYFVHDGDGVFETSFGLLPYREGDYVLIPRGTTFRVVLGETENTFLVVESRGSLVPPKRYLNQYGQFLEHAPYCERDIRKPEELVVHLDKGDFEVRVRVGSSLTSYWYDFHPLDVVGWDGCEYPWIFNIHDFEPITGRVHQPPPVHQTFQGPNFVVCSFVPRKLDYHPLSIPVPYNHSNIDSEEMLYYVNGNFGSRRGIERGSMTLHPRGIPHGPHPGAVEKSLGAEQTEEMAVMVDTFHPLQLTRIAQLVDDQKYPYSWYE
jgi:homogentisate 1,2-dioxygenase